MSYTLRPYQSRVVTDLFSWWTTHNKVSDVPIMALPTAAGKSIIIAEIVRQMFEQWPDYHPRTVVLVPSKELAVQNAEKLQSLLPANISVGFVSASLGKRQHMADVIVATIGSIHKSAHLLGNIKAVIVDECHLISPKASDAGMYRKFLTALAKYCDFRVCGATASPFRGNGVWLTDGDDPLFTGIAATVTMRELLDAKYLSPLVTPPESIETRIDASGVVISNGDYKVNELSDVVEQYLFKVASETVHLAAERKKWIAFTPTVANAHSLRNKLRVYGVIAEVVTGDTEKRERERLIASFRAGNIRCLITVVALSTGFDVPDVDCLIWCRPTKSPVFYLQGFGRCLRIAPGKVNALVLDFTDTVERMGPIDTIKGRAKKGGGGDAPYVVCDNCGARNHAAAKVCVECGAVIREDTAEEKKAVASRAAVLSSQVAPPPVVWRDVTRVDYQLHRKESKPDSLRVDYYSGILMCASEWVCLEHGGFAEQKARAWLVKRLPEGFAHQPGTTGQLLEWIKGGMKLQQPTRIATRQNGRFTEVLSHEFPRTSNTKTATEELAQ